MISMIFGCSSNSESCEPITCLNGGVSVGCECECSTGYTGSNCDAQTTPSSITITKVVVKSFPNSQSDGSGWDLGLPTPDDVLPDIYILISTGANTIYDSPTFYENAIANGSTFYEFLPNVTVTDFITPYVINIMDYDNSSSDDFMVNKAFFIYNNTNGFPEVITLLDVADSILVDIYLSYNF
jgi:hypothetical protein